MLTVALWSALAGAADLPEYVDVELPKFNVQLFRPAVDARRTLWTEETGGLVKKPRMGVQLASNLLGDPFVLYWTDAQGNKGQSSVVGTALQFDLQPSLAYKRFRLAIDVPVWAFATSDTGSGGSGLGDVSADLRYTVLDREVAPIGFSVTGRIDTPTSTMPGSLGMARTGVGWELGIGVDRDLGPLRFVGNLATRGVPAAVASHATDASSTWDDQLMFRLGGSYLLDSKTGVSLETVGAATYAQLGNKEEGANGGFPVEILAGGWRRLRSDLVVRGGLGTGLTGGVGAARYRAVVAITWDPPPLGGYPKPSRPVLVDVRWGHSESEHALVSVGAGSTGIEITVDPDGKPTVGLATESTPPPDLSRWVPADAPVVAVRDDLVRVSAASGGPPTQIFLRHLGDGRVEIRSGERTGYQDLLYGDDPVEVDLRVRWGQTPRSDYVDEQPAVEPPPERVVEPDMIAKETAPEPEVDGLRGLPGYDPSWTTARAGWEAKAATPASAPKADPEAEAAAAAEVEPLRGLPGDDPAEAKLKAEERRLAMEAAEAAARAAGAPAATDPNEIFEPESLRGLPGKDPLAPKEAPKVVAPAPRSDVPFEELDPVVEGPLRGMPGTSRGSSKPAPSTGTDDSRSDPYEIYRDDAVRGMPGTSRGRDEVEPVPTAKVAAYKAPSRLPRHLVEGYLQATPHVLFTVDDFAVPLAAREDLAALASKLAAGSDRIRVVGHADPREINVTELADQRARAVRDLLVRGGVPAGRIELLVLAADAPLDGGDSETSLEVNRRVDVVVGDR